VDPCKPGPGIFCKRTFATIAKVALAALIYSVLAIFLAIAVRAASNFVIQKFTSLTYDREMLLGFIFYFCQQRLPFFNKDSRSSTDKDNSADFILALSICFYYKDTK
jgi:hypothetical protein